jgi:lysophospholipase L1-like esterase
MKSSFKLNLGIAILVPLAFFLLLELFCRLLGTDNIIKNWQNDLTLEMPTWLLADQGTGHRVTRITGDKKTLAWMNYFEEGQGFRVRLKPNIEAQFFNTFSRIKYYLDQPFYVKSNRLGFRGPDPTKRQDSNILRVVVFGDSSSFGWGVNQDEIYTALLSKKLQDKMPEKQIEVANFAIPGDSSEYGKLIFNKYSELYPADIVILGFGANDAKLTYLAHHLQVEKFTQRAGLHNISYLLSKSELFKTMDSLIGATPKRTSFAASPLVKRPSVTRKRFRQNLDYMGQKGGELGAEHILLLGLCTPGSYLKSMRNLAKQQNLLYFNAQSYLRELLPKIKTEQLYPQLVADMREAYPQALRKNELFYITSDGCHPNKLGHRLIADQLAELLFSAVNQTGS